MLSAVDLNVSADQYWKQHACERPIYFGIGVQHYNERNKPVVLKPCYSVACPDLSHDEWTVLYIMHDVMKSAEELNPDKYERILDKASVFDSICLRKLKVAWRKCKDGDPRYMRVQIIFATQRDSARSSVQVTKPANSGRAGSPRYVCHQKSLYT